ncbi:hypothetical protein COLO4_32313 [Corchorus olitorius]|uniref:Protein kinase domain-containing protein n=1 Tax=Corchorus olitorius TaxID=93759 RepID=A0A1R3GZR6_9ROSI|nr:hypothetical protein COLO4_32313 [Corchorus olitorius]
MTGNEVSAAVSSPSSSDQKLTLDSQVPVHMSSSAASGTDDMVASDSGKAFSIDESETAKTSAGKGRRTVYLCNTTAVEDITDNFDSNNLIGLTQFGRLYRGKIERTGKETRFVTAKIWDERADRFTYYLDKKTLMREEVKILNHPSLKHPNLVKLMGGCFEKHVKAIIYDLYPLDTLHNYMSRDEFSWTQRIKVALQFARLVKFLHCQDDPYVIHNIDTTHIMLDEDCNPILFDFGQISGGLIGPISREKEYAFMTTCYCDPHYIETGGHGHARVYHDVYSFGLILVELITKRITSEDEIISKGVKSTRKWVRGEHKPGYSLVCQSLRNQAGYDPSDGLMITQLAMDCINDAPPKRPTIETAVERLENLSVVKSHAGFY